MKRLLVATDLSARSDRALNRALALSDQLKAQLIVLHVVDEELPSSVANGFKEGAESAINDHLDSLPTSKRKKVTRKVVIGNPSRDIVKEAEGNGAGLIIMGRHRDDYLADLFLGTTVERVIRFGNLPGLVVRKRMKRPYRRVLVGVDFSVYSRRAIEFALKYVPGGEIFLLHAFQVPFKGFLFGQSILNEVTKEHQEQMDAMLEEEKQAFITTLPSPPASLKSIMIEGSAREVISRQVEKLRPDLLVIGTHGRTGVAHAVIGSVAQDLLSDPPCDVLAVKAW